MQQRSHFILPKSGRANKNFACRSVAVGRNIFAAMDIITLTPENPDYPAEFRTIVDDMPPVLYALGNTELLTHPHKVAIIGGRNADSNGIDAACRLGRKYTEEGWVVVSGLAAGCDTAAHRGCLDAGGKTIAIVATGLDRVHPKANAALQKDILRSGGLILSEQLLGTKANPTRLIARTRLQAALANPIVVAQCAERSGTMHTVAFAQKYGKHLLAVSYDYLTEQTVGNRLLIDSGIAEALLISPKIEIIL